MPPFSSSLCCTYSFYPSTSSLVAAYYFLLFLSSGLDANLLQVTAELWTPVPAENIHFFHLYT